MDLKLDSNGNFVIENNDLVLTTGQEATIQRIKRKLKTLYGEWFLNRTIGIPYFQQVFNKGGDPIVVESSFKNEIINDPAITELTYFSIDLNTTTRVLTVEFKANSIDGDIDFSEVLT